MKQQRKKEGKKLSFYDPVNVDKLKSHLKKELKMAEALEDKKFSNKL